MHPWNDVFERNLSDKFMHNYGPIYHYLLDRFRQHYITILEIGVWEGGSLRSWSELFPFAKIVGMDNDPARARFDGGRALIEIGDAGKKEDLIHVASLHGPFDIIIDDGSHMPNDVRTAFNTLWPSLHTGGVYVIEDLDVAWYSEYQKGTTIIDQELARLKSETRSVGIQDRFTVFAGELVAFIKHAS